MATQDEVTAFIKSPEFESFWRKCRFTAYPRSDEHGNYFLEVGANSEAAQRILQDISEGKPTALGDDLSPQFIDTFRKLVAGSGVFATNFVLQAPAAKND